MLKDEIPNLVAYIESCKHRLDSSKELIEIFENDLLKYIEDMFRSEMGTQTYEDVKPRIPPINILNKIIDKLTNIYNEGVSRTVVDGSDADQDLLDMYVDMFDADTTFNHGNEFLNLDRINLMQPYYDELNETPALRAVRNDGFLVYSSNKMNPLIPTHVMMSKGKAERIKVDKRATKTKQYVDTWVVWTNDEIIIFDMDGIVRTDLMAAFEMDGTNPFGVLPFEYINNSRNYLVPPTDSDTKRMTVLIPALLADINYAAKFMSFSQIFAYNMDKETWTIAPNSVHFIDDKPLAEAQARVEVVKPDVDIVEVIQLTVTQLAMWLNSRGVKLGQVGDISAENLASGVSKIIDEMDTTKLKEKQANLYSKRERSFWNKVLKHMHPVWVAENRVTNKHLFTPTAHVLTEFGDQDVAFDRTSMVNTLVTEINNGLKSRDTAIRELNPDWDESRIEQEMVLIDGIEPQGLEADDGLAENEDTDRPGSDS